MSNKLIGKVSLPYNITQGSFAFRQDKSIKLVDKLYRNIYPKFRNGKLTSKQLQKSVDEVLEKKVRVITKTYDDPEVDGSCDILYSPISRSITGTTLELSAPVDKIRKHDLVTILHEFQHITDQLFHPKYLKRNQLMFQKEMFTDKYDNLYDFIYKRETPKNTKESIKILNDIKYKILKFLRGMSIEDKINYLQDIRYSLIMEDQAYKTQRKYAKILNKKHVRINPYDLINENKSHMLQEKIDLVTDTTFKLIKKERGKHAAKIKKCKQKNKISQ